MIRIAIVVFCLFVCNSLSFATEASFGVRNSVAISAGVTDAYDDTEFNMIASWTVAYKRVLAFVNLADLTFRGSEADGRYRNETFSNGTTVCRDRTNGQFAEKEKCEDGIDLDYAFSTDANFIVADLDPVQIYCGAGLRLADKTKVYGSIGVDMKQFDNGLKLFGKGHISDDFYQAHIGVRF